MSTNEEKEAARNRYRFSGYRYGLRGPNHGMSEYIQQRSSFYAFPRGDREDENEADLEMSSSSED